MNFRLALYVRVATMSSLSRVACIKMRSLATVLFTFAFESLRPGISPEPWNANSSGTSHWTVGTMDVSRNYPAAHGVWRDPSDGSKMIRISVALCLAAVEYAFVGRKGKMVRAFANGNVPASILASIVSQSSSRYDSVDLLLARSIARALDHFFADW